MGYVGNNGTIETHYGASITDRTTATASGTGAFRHGSSTHTAQADFAPSVTPINSYAQGSGGGGYTVRGGDTLASIAAAVWGDAAAPAGAFSAWP